MKTFKFSLVLRTRENTDVFISLDDNIYGIHSKRINILYVLTSCAHWVRRTMRLRPTYQNRISETRKVDIHKGKTWNVQTDRYLYY